MNISVVIPCYNESENIVDAVRMITQGIDASVSAYEIIIVDDGSTDGSRTLITKLLEENGRIRAVYHQENRGKGAALRSGFGESRMEWILMMDADLQIDISELKKFLPYCLEEGDLIAGVRTNRAEGIFRMVVSRVYNAVVSAVVGTHMRDVGCPFKLVRTSFLRTLPLISEGFAIDAELFLRLRQSGRQFKELAVACRPRLKGRSKVTFRHLLMTFADIILLRFGNRT